MGPVLGHHPVAGRLRGGVDLAARAGQRGPRRPADPGQLPAHARGPAGGGEDYLHTPGTKTLALLLNLFVCVLVAALAVFCILKVALTGGAV